MWISIETVCRKNACVQTIPPSESPTRVSIPRSAEIFETSRLNALLGQEQILVGDGFTLLRTALYNGINLEASYSSL